MSMFEAMRSEESKENKYNYNPGFSPKSKMIIELSFEEYLDQRIVKALDAVQPKSSVQVEDRKALEELKRLGKSVDILFERLKVLESKEVPSKQQVLSFIKDEVTRVEKGLKSLERNLKKQDTSKAISEKKEEEADLGLGT